MVSVMATGFARLRINWGGLDVTLAQQETPSYSPSQIVSGGDSAQIGDGVGVRRATLVIDRADFHGGADAAAMHFDWLNTTGGAPDDTWTAADFITMEGHLTTWFAAVANRVPNGYKLTQINWHRVGSGVPHPNPAERAFDLTSPIPASAAGQYLPPQAACSITFRTAVRRSWGRTYLPFNGATNSAQTILTSVVDGLATATHALVTGAAANDFLLVVVSETLHSALAVERIEVDDNIDVIRRRRWKQSTYRKILP
jgi:hypothetical protein